MSAEEMVRWRPFGPEQSPPVVDLAALHRELLPSSPALRLGKGFLEDFYYAVLPADGLIVGQVAYVDERPAGFVVVTTDSNGFLSTAIRRHWSTLAKVLLHHPPSPKGVWESAQLARSRDGESEAGLGEILSLGVRKPEAGGATSSKLRRTLARDLLDRGLSMLGDRPVIALVDERNTSARVLYTSLGWTVAGKVTAGWPVPQIIYRSSATEGHAANTA